MKAKDLHDMVDRMDPEKEVTWGYIITEDDIMREAEYQGITCSRPNAQQIVRAMDSQADNSDHVVDYYLKLWKDGELEEEMT